MEPHHAVSAAGEGQTAPDVQSLTDIQSYLANFNKEIGTDNAPAILFTPGSEPAQQVSFNPQEQLFNNVRLLFLLAVDLT